MLATTLRQGAAGASAVRPTRLRLLTRAPAFSCHAAPVAPPSTEPHYPQVFAARPPRAASFFVYDDCAWKFGNVGAMMCGEVR